MTRANTDDRRADSRPRPFQYSLRALLILTTVVAIACSVFFALPGWVAFVATICFVISTAAVLTVLLVYSRGYVRTFCVGALFPAAVCLLPAAIMITAITLDGIQRWSRSYSDEERLGCLALLVMHCVLVVVNGWLAVFVRRLVEAPRHSASPRQDQAAGPPEAGDAAPECESNHKPEGLA